MQVFKLFWKEGARQRSHFMFFETEHATVDALAKALNAGLVPGNELFFDKSNPNELRVTRRQRTAISADQIARVQECWENIVGLEAA